MSKHFEVDSIKEAALLLEIDKFAKIFGCEGISSKYDHMIVALRNDLIEEFQTIWEKEGEVE